MLRAMSPELIVTDEIATKEDAKAIMQCFGTGVAVIGSAHGSCAEEVMARECLKPLFGKGGFRKIIVLQKEGVGINLRICPKVSEVKA